MFGAQSGNSKTLQHVRRLKLSKQELASCVYSPEVFKEGSKNDATEAAGAPNSAPMSREPSQDQTEPGPPSNVKRIAEGKREIEMLGEICLPVAEEFILKSNLTDSEKMPSLIFSLEYDFLGSAKYILKRLQVKKTQKNLAPRDTNGSNTTTLLCWLRSCRIVLYRGAAKTTIRCYSQLKGVGRSSRKQQNRQDTATDPSFSFAQ
jgi:hypothetical protein